MPLQWPPASPMVQNTVQLGVSVETEGEWPDCRPAMFSQPLMAVDQLTRSALQLSLYRRRAASWLADKSLQSVWQ